MTVTSAPVTSFSGRWRPYQQLALSAFEADRAAGRRQTFIVCPPGAGKTLLGWEAIARIDRPALVLVPGRTVLEQWRQTATQFGASASLTESLTEQARAVTLLTYQSLCTTDAQDVLGELAHRQVAQEAAALRGIDVYQALHSVRLDADYEERLRAARRALTARATKGEIDDLEIRQVLSGPARNRLAALREAGVGCVVLDECHHLSGLWGRVIRHVLEELGNPHVVALTATPDWYPTRTEAELLDAIHGPVDFQVPTPAVVRDGYLAPYLTLAAFCAPTPDELATLRLQEEALRELIDDVLLFDGRPTGTPDVDLSFTTWITRRLERRTGGAAAGEDGDGEVLSWKRAFARWPAQLTAAARIARAQGVPAEAPLEEALLEAPTSDDWRTAVGDWVVGCLRRSDTAEAEVMVQTIGLRLKLLGWGLDRWGVRRIQSATDQVVMHSRAKLDCTRRILVAEARARQGGAGAAPAGRVVAAVVCEVAGDGSGDSRVVGVREVVRDLAQLSGPGGAGPRCLGISAQGVWAPAASALSALAALGAGWTSTPSATCGPDVVDLLPPPGLDGGTGGWVLAVTDALADGRIDVLVGTRGLLGEGWNCPALTTLVDLTTATTSVAVEQLRGRPLRLDPADPKKVATLWDVVCVADGLADGHRDYARFARRHEHLHAPCPDGVIERGVSHVDAALSPTAAPDAATAELVTADSFERLSALDAQRELWHIGTPYRGVELPAVLVRDGRPREVTVTSTAAHLDVPSVAPADGWARAVQSGRTVAGGSFGAGVVLAAIAAAAGLVWLAVPLLVLGVVGAGFGARRALDRDVAEHPAQRGLDRAVGCLLDAAVAAGTVTAEQAHADLDVREDGSVRVLFPLAAPQAADLLAQALSEALADPFGQDWWVSRPWPHETLLGGLKELAGLDAPRPRCWQAVPEHFARAAPRRAAYLAAHQRWFGPGELADLREDPAAEPDGTVDRGAGLSVRRRTVWS